MKRRSIQFGLLTGLIVMLAAGLLSAGEKKEAVLRQAPATEQKQTTIKQAEPKDGERRIDYTLEGLTHAMDLWYDAMLKEDLELADRYESLIDNILVEDLKATRLACDRLKKRAGSKDLAHAKQECDAQVAYLNEMIKEKKAMAEQIQNCRQFAEKYRRLGGYINKLRSELGMPKAKFAEIPIERAQKN